MGKQFIKMVHSRVMATLFISRVLIKDIFNCNFFRMAFTGKQIIVTPPNEDHRATYSTTRGKYLYCRSNL